MSKKITHPVQALSKTVVNDTQRELQGMAVALGLTARELGAMARRAMLMWQRLQTGQKR